MARRGMKVIGDLGFWSGWHNSALRMPVFVRQISVAEPVSLIRVVRCFFRFRKSFSL
jgi:hypothetical protein